MHSNDIAAFLDEKVPEHIDGFSTDSCVELSPMNSDSDVLATNNRETMPNSSTNELDAFYNSRTPESGAHPFVCDCAPLAVRFCCSKEPLVGKNSFYGFPA